MTEGTILTVIVALLCAAVPILLWMDGMGWLGSWSRVEKETRE